MTVFRGRLFCNTICPVGALLSLFSRYSFFRITFNKEACTHCGNCEHTCKAGSDRQQKPDDRYIPLRRLFQLCFFLCQRRLAVSSAISGYETGGDSRYPSCKGIIFQPTDSRQQPPYISGHKCNHCRLAADRICDCRRRKGKMNRKDRKKWPPLTPPGSISLERFKDKCTGCQICVVRCPSQVLRPTGLEYGLDYMLKPRLAYISSYCNYECTVCSDVCPTGAIKPLTIEEKTTTQVGIATFFKGRCVVNTEEKDCGACAEHCPTGRTHGSLQRNTDNPADQP